MITADDLARAGMRLKPLVWKKLSEASTADTYGTRYIGHCSFGEYFIKSSAWGAEWAYSRLGYATFEYTTEDAAKAAAQADYQTRILSALEPTP